MQSIRVTRQYLMQEIGRETGWGRQPGKWNAIQRQDAQRILDIGIRNFYVPPTLPNETVFHSWSFLQPEFEIQLKVNKEDYDLPEDFAGLINELTYSSSDDSWCPLCVVSELVVRKNRQELGGSAEYSGYPQQVAIIPVGDAGTEYQRHKMMVFPCPNDDFRIRGRYRSNPLAFSDDTPHPMGGQPHAETLRLSVMAAIEQELEGGNGPRYSQFLMALKTSVDFDRRYTGPQVFPIGDEEYAGAAATSPGYRMPIIRMNGTEI